MQTSGSRSLRLDAFLAAALASGQAGSRSKAQEAIRAGGVLVNGRPVTKAAATLAAGDVVLAVLLPAPQLQVSLFVRARVAVRPADVCA